MKTPEVSVEFKKPKKKYTQSFWETINIVAEEGKYLATSKRFPYESTVQFLEKCKDEGVPQLFVVDKTLDKCVGWCDALRKPKTLDVGVLGVGLLADYRDKGIGREVIAKIVEMSKDFGYKTIVLEARASNVRAIHLYESIGFVKYNVVVGGYQSKRGVEPEDVVEMSMVLE